MLILDCGKSIPKPLEALKSQLNCDGDEYIKRLQGADLDKYRTCIASGDIKCQIRQLIVGIDLFRYLVGMANGQLKTVLLQIIERLMSVANQLAKLELCDKDKAEQLSCNMLDSNTVLLNEYIESCASDQTSQSLVPPSFPFN